MAPRPLLRRRRRSCRTGEREDLQYLFVLTYGRSGSTLLQGVLNAIPGVLVRGENHQVLRHLWRFETEAREERDVQRRLRLRHGRLASGPTNSFYGIDGFPVTRARESIRRLALDTVLRPEPDTRIVGFKEIRWEEPDVSAYVAWLRVVFPGARFVVNTRDLDDVARSKWWADRIDAREHLAAVEQRLLDVAADLDGAAYRVHYDDYVEDPARLQGLFTWLGVPFDLELVRRTLAVRHSY